MSEITEEDILDIMEENLKEKVKKLFKGEKYEDNRRK